MLKKVLVANRGEIAVRIIRAARELGVETVACYSDTDAGALHVRLADEKVALGGNSARDTYLNAEKIINAARLTACDSLHPGYGFFAENADFARSVKKAGLVFIGPSPEIIALMGDKERARRVAAESGVPVIPGCSVTESLEEVAVFGNTVGYPILLKAVAGGSGRGMRLVTEAGQIAERVEEAKKEALSSFGNGDLIAEKYLSKPRHIEAQIFGDNSGNIIHLGERECSIQRRHQKIIEEAPAAFLHPLVREELLKAAVELARKVRYTNSGTVEFLVENGEQADGKFFFIEMNTRIQVEHPVTESITGIDLVKLQFSIAAGENLPRRQDQVTFQGHAIEFRISGEDPAKNFLPVTGKILYASRTGGPGVREDGWAENGRLLSPHYDSLLSKLIITGADRAEALGRARAVLDAHVVEGFPTTLDFHRWIVNQEEYCSAPLDVYWVTREYKGQLRRASRVAPLRLEPLSEVN